MNAATDVRVPTRLIDVLTTPDGRRVTLRPVLPQDAELQQRLVRGLSTTARTQRFFAPIHELPPEWLRRMTMVDHVNHVALIAETFEAHGAVAIGEARYVVDGHGAAEFALVVADDWQRHGIGRRLVASLRDHAREAGHARLEGEVLADNGAMLQLARSLGFSLRAHPQDARLVQVSLALQRAGATAAVP
jgi:acetyltransferase